MSAKKILVTGAGGFIGSHLVNRLVEEGHYVRGVDIKESDFLPCFAEEFLLLDLRNYDEALTAAEGMDEIYALAADMGGMGFISNHHAEILHGNTMIDFNTIEAARVHGVDKLLYASSACIYPNYKQTETDVTALKEDDAYPADPQDAYGWEKLTTEKLLHHYRLDYGLETRCVRFHNIYGPEGTWDGGREKAPAALSRKIAAALLSGDHRIEIWGDGEQTRSFCHIDDCLEGLIRLMASDHHEPINLGNDRLISINALAELIADLAGIQIHLQHIEGPEGVRGRNSDNSQLREVLGWEPSVDLEEGLKKTYSWILTQLQKRIANATIQPQPPRSTPSTTPAYV